MALRLRDLAESVEKGNIAVEYRDQVEGRVRGGGGGLGALDALQREIAGEIAYSLGRAGRKISAAIEEALALAAQLQQGGLSPAEVDDLRARYQHCRERAQTAVQNLCIQRECLGLRRHEDVFRHYAIPGPL